MRGRGWRTWARVATVAVAFAALARPAAAGTGWADSLFREQKHDFGPVPRGAKLRHAFVLTNRTGDPVSVVDVRASCGCTTGRATQSLVPPGASASIEAEMDTRNFVGKKDTTLYVTLIRLDGQQSEARLGVSSTILSDVVLNPGTIDFGAVSRGQTPTLTLTIDRVGLPTWQIRRMISSCKGIDAVLTETVRDGPSVGYLLKVSLRPDAPVGPLRDEIHVVTNDRETPSFPIQVAATIRGDLSASPSVLALPAALTSDAVQGRFLVRASKPFTVRAIEGEGDGFTAQADDASPRPVHLVTVTFRPGESQARGDLRRVFRLHTDLVGEPPLELTTTVHDGP